MLSCCSISSLFLYHMNQIVLIVPHPLEVIVKTIIANVGGRGHPTDLMNFVVHELSKLSLVLKLLLPRT